MFNPTGTASPVLLNRDSITQLITDFYDDVRVDPVLGPTFETVLAGRWAAHLPRMIEFWSTVMLGTRSFKGNVYAKHMVVPGVTPDHFARWMSLWHRHTTSAFEPASASRFQEAAASIASQLFRGHFGRDLNLRPTAPGAQP